MKRHFYYVVLLVWSGLLAAVADPNDLPNKTIARSDCCGPTCKGSVPKATLNQVFLQTIAPSDLKCYPYEITKPGTYVVTRDFQHVATTDGEPLIRVLANNVTIDFQTFSLYQQLPSGQVDGTATLLKSNLVEIGDGVTPISNITLLNGTLSGAAGVGIVINPLVSNVILNGLKVTNCLAGGIALAGASNVNIECCSITNHGQRNVIDQSSGLTLPIVGNFLDSMQFDLAATNGLGSFGIVAVDSKQVAIKDSEILCCGSSELEHDAVGIYMQGCIDVEVVRSATSSNSCAATTTMLSSSTTSNPIAKGMLFKDCKKGFVDCCLITCNKGSGVVGIDLINSEIFHISNSNIYGNRACGPWIHDMLPTICPGPITIDLFTRCSPCDDFVDAGVDVNLSNAYADYKVGLTLPKTDPSCITNWQMLTDPDDWTSFMDGYHAIELALEPYSYISRAYGIRLFDTNYVTIEAVSVVDTVADHNSAWGILIDRNSCSAAEGLCNIVKFSKVLGTRSFNDQAPANVTYAAEIEVLFGDILDETSGQQVRRYESYSMIGRSVGIEVRNCAECTVLHNNLIKGNSSEHTFAAGVFLNRATKSDLVGNRIECNCGSDIGFGLLNRTVNPTDLAACNTLFANGLMNRSNLIDPPLPAPTNPPFYPDGTAVIDKNINYGVFWSNGGIFSIKHAFTSDLGLINNLGTHENIQIFFDAETQPNLPCLINQPDLAATYIA